MRRRSTYDRIVEQFFAAKPEIILGGGSANFLPKGTPGSRRADGTDYIAKFRDAGYVGASTAAELKAAAAASTLKRSAGSPPRWRSRMAKNAASK